MVYTTYSSIVQKAIMFFGVCGCVCVCVSMSVCREGKIET